MSEEMDYAQLVAQEDEIKILMAKCAELEAELSTWIQAIGLASTLKPNMVIDISDPIGMMQKVVRHFKQLEAKTKRLREALNAMAEGEIYPVQVALAELAATELPIGDSGILDGSNRTTGGWIGQL